MFCWKRLTEPRGGGGELVNGYKQTADRIGGILELLLQSGRTHTHSLTGTLVIGSTWGSRGGCDRLHHVGLLLVVKYRNESTGVCLLG